MTILILLACSLLVSILVAWLLTNRLALRMPRKESMTTMIPVAAIVLLVSMALLPDFFIVVSNMKLLTLHFKIALTLLAATSITWAVACTGCSKRPQPVQPIHWSGTETGYRADSPPDTPKEGP